MTTKPLQDRLHSPWEEPARSADDEVQKLYKLCREAADSLQALEEELKGLREDAERYRWLREHRDVTLLTAFFGNGCINKYRDHIDAYIDAAIDQARKERP